MVAVKTFIKTLATVFCVLGIIVYTSMLLFPNANPENAEDFTNSRPALIFLDGLLVFGLYCLNRKKNNAPDKSAPDSKKVSSYLPEVPANVLHDMRKYYSATQAANDARILKESFQLIQQTTDFDTFFSRLGLAEKTALTLLQAVQAKCRGINAKVIVRECEQVLSNVQNAKIVFLDNSYNKETASALQLKTSSGQCNRLKKYLEKLQAYEEQFSDVKDTYDGYTSKVQALLKDAQPTSAKTVAHPTTAKQVSVADEIIKFKKLLDDGAISQEEYEAQKKRLLKT